jgi:hypothetical protein
MRGGGPFDMLSIYIKHSEVDVYNAGKDTVAVRAGKDEVHVLNPVAAQILEECDGRAMNEISESVARTYPDIPSDAIVTDVASALEQLEAIGLIQHQAREPSEGAPS